MVWLFQNLDAIVNLYSRFLVNTILRLNTISLSTNHHCGVYVFIVPPLL